MPLHEYSIIGHHRATIGRWIAVASIAVAPALTSMVIWLTGVPQLDWIRGTLVGLSVSSSVVYLILHWAFNAFGWRCLDRILHLPDLNGKWTIKGATLNEDRTTRFDWLGELEIIQKWDRIVINLATKTSGSESDTASIRVLPNSGCKLSYSYQNRPIPGRPDPNTLAGAPPLQKHEGFCQLEFDAPRKTAIGYYFNSMGRLTVGAMELTKAT